AKIGSSAFLKSESSPLYSSRSISNPTNKKKTAIRPSLIQCSTRKPPTYVCQRARYCVRQTELASSREITRQMMSKMPLDFSESKKFLNVLDNARGTRLIGRFLR